MPSPTLSYFTVQPDKWTFETPKIRSCLEPKLTGTVLNACCGPTKLSHNDTVIRNDINQDINADLHVDVSTIDEHIPANSIDTIVYDPPFSANQAATTYDFADGSRYDTETKQALNTVLKPGGTIIQFGYTSTIMPTEHNYTLSNVALWNTLGRQHDWIATTARKPADPTAQPTPTALTASVSPNEHTTGDLGGAATSGNENNSITYHYQQLPHDADLREIVTEHIETHLDGKTLDLSSYPRTLGHDSDVVENSIQDTDKEFEYDAQALSSQFADSYFDTVVFDPHPEAFQHTATVNGTRTGLDTAYKNAAHPLIAGNGTFIQIAHTATCMPARLSYTRRHITQLSHPHAQDLFLTIDEKQHTDIGDYALDHTPEDITYSDSEARGNYSCIRCGTTWHLNPAWYESCLDCGAHPGNYCVTPDGTPRHVPHDDRRGAANDAHGPGNCIDTPTPHNTTERAMSTESPADTTTQKSLGGYND